MIAQWAAVAGMWVFGGITIAILINMITDWPRF